MNPPLRICRIKSQSTIDIGTGEMFYRKSSISIDKPTHKANVPIKKKNPNNQGAESRFNTR